jgi:general secretion pathway protein A
MNKKKLLNLYGLKWNPFEQSIPLEALITTPQIDSFCFRIENLVMDGGFGMITGNPGCGKSVALRILASRLEKLKEIKVGVLTRPQSVPADFYREIGDIFGVTLKSTNRWGGHKLLRKEWNDHIRSTLLRPVLLIDEAQEMLPIVLNELRMLSSDQFDSEVILTVVFCGDQRLPEKFKEESLIPLGSRIRSRLTLEGVSKENLINLLNESMGRAGNKNLINQELINILTEHSAGNFRVMMIMAEHLLLEAAKKELPQLNETLFFEVYGQQKKIFKKK